ncbi:MAG: EF-hand domain-containing protein [Pseudomonadota bacterium]
MYRALTAAFALTAVVATPAVQAERRSPFADLDLDADGLVSREEFQLPEERRGPRFMEADADGDGAVSRLELEEATDQRQDEILQRFDSIDTDGNGVVTRLEFTDHAFDRLDADDDGFISMEEAWDGRRMHRGRRGPRGNQSEAES